MNVFKHLLVLIGLIVMVSSLDSVKFEKKKPKKYELPSEIIEALERLIKQTEDIKDKIRIKNNLNEVRYAQSKRRAKN